MTLDEAWQWLEMCCQDFAFERRHGQERLLLFAQESKRGCAGEPTTLRVQANISRFFSGCSFYCRISGKLVDCKVCQLEATLTNSLIHADKQYPQQ